MKTVKLLKEKSLDFSLMLYSSNPKFCPIYISDHSVAQNPTKKTFYKKNKFISNDLKIK